MSEGRTHADRCLLRILARRIRSQSHLVAWLGETRSNASRDSGRSSLLNESVSYQSLAPRDALLTGGVWDYLALAPALARREGPELRVLLVGFAGGTVARQIAEAYREDARVRIFAIELDPAVLAAGRRYFAFDSIPELTTKVGDARVEVESLRGSFHVIIVDVFRGLYLPAHLVTQEFFEACRRHLEPGGVLAMNVATPIGSWCLLGALGATLDQVFEDVRLMQLPKGGVRLRTRSSSLPRDR